MRGTHEGQRIAWVFHLGHGRYTQFLNFQDNLPTEHVWRSQWIGIPPLVYQPGTGKLALFRRIARFRGNQLRGLNSALAERQDWQALFLAAQSVQFLPVLRRIPSYLYIDMTAAQLRAFAPWYNHMLAPEVLTNSALRGLQDRAHRMLFRSARGVFAMSEWAAGAVRHEYGLPASSVHVTLPGANLRCWHFVERSARQDGPVRILMVGGEFTRKGGPMLLEWAQRTNLRGWELDIVTWAPELPNCLRLRLAEATSGQHATCTLSTDATHVRFHTGIAANSPELRELYARADVFCLPTRADGSSNAALEAMATGLPVLVGAVGGIPEIIRNDRDGLLLEPGSPVDLQAKLEELLLDAHLRHRLGRAARDRCEEYLNTKRQVRQILSVIDSG